MTEQCRKCKKNFKMLNEKTGYCYYCYLQEFNQIPEEWKKGEKE